MELVIHQQIYYSNKNLVPLRDVAESLLALEAVIRQSPDVLDALFPGTKISSVDVFINELKSDSIWEDLIVKFVFGSQQKLDELINNIRERVGMDNLVRNPKLLSIVIITMVFAGATYFMLRDKKATPEQKSTIEANNNTIINIGAGLLEFDALEFKALIEGAVKDKDTLARNAIKVVRPAKRDPDASITFNGNSELMITPASIQAMPQVIPEPEDEQFVEDFPAIDLEIRATDLDSTKRGWAVVVPELGKNRVRLQIDPSINPEIIAEQRRFKGSVTVIFGYDKQNNKVPKLVFLRKIVDELANQ
ncbi:hypothetical protein [Thermithiobacillus plumbiphilus]|uniref:Uncharacterized protein n=1 Tax=Thermithiobacillus plumbiphilus TaxID=1729899 RepID=A0ABU9DBP3_9PROT